ncbi:MAG: VOC family protein [Dehalococcoidia bacterium]
MPIDIRQPTLHNPPMPSAVVYFQIATADPAAARDFYSQLFDWDFSSGAGPTPITINPKGPADFDPKGSFFQLAPGAAPFITLFVRVEDLQSTVAKAEELKARVVVPITQVAGGTHLAVISTPEGHSIGIVQA